jgi:hypothetical protein
VLLNGGLEGMLCAATAQVGSAAASMNSRGIDRLGATDARDRHPRPCHAQNFRRRPSRVLVRTNLLQTGSAPGPASRCKTCAGTSVRSRRGGSGSCMAQVPPAWGITKIACVRGVIWGA